MKVGRRRSIFIPLIRLLPKVGRMNDCIVCHGISDIKVIGRCRVAIELQHSFPLQYGEDGRESIQFSDLDIAPIKVVIHLLRPESITQMAVISKETRGHPHLPDYTVLIDIKAEAGVDEGLLEVYEMISYGRSGSNRIYRDKYEVHIVQHAQIIFSHTLTMRDNTLMHVAVEIVKVLDFSWTGI